jgi:hypothetical protein
MKTSPQVELKKMAYDLGKVTVISVPLGTLI